jgi:hypothetical protein
MVRREQVEQGAAGIGQHFGSIWAHLTFTLLQSVSLHA